MMPFFAISVSSTAQIQLSGVIADVHNNPVPFAYIGLFSLPDSAVIDGAMADEQGNYLLQVNKFGNYTLKASMMGYKENFSEALHFDSLSGKSTVMNIQLGPFENELKEVSTHAIRRMIEFKNGNITVNVENSPLAKGNTVYDLLSKLPGVRITNNVIELNGKAGVIIMLDGRVQYLTDAQLLNMLKSMNAELVEKIELMKNPPAKYDASGTSGMINIKTKRTKSLGYSGSFYTSSSQGDYGRSMQGATLNYKSDKVVLFSALNYSYGIYQDNYTYNSKFKNASSVTEFNLVNGINDVSQGINYKLGANWTVNKNNTVGFKIDGGPASYNSRSAGRNTISQDNIMGYDHLNVTTDIPDRWTLNNYNVNAEHRFDTLGTVLVFNTDYTRLSENISSNVQNFFLNKNNQETLPANIFKSQNINASDILVSKLDFTKILSTKTSFETGVKTSFINTANNYLFERKYNSSDDYYKDTALTNNYAYSEQTYAAYCNYIRSVGKFNFQLGLRGEYTSLTGNNTTKGFGLKKEYFKLFHNISIEYAASEQHNFQLNLNKRLDRPPYQYLMPFQVYQDQYNYFEGNPFLLPHYNNTIELTHSLSNLLPIALLTAESTMYGSFI